LWNCSIGESNPSAFNWFHDAIQFNKSSARFKSQDRRAAQQLLHLEGSWQLISKLSHLAKACMVQQPGKQFLMSPILRGWSRFEFSRELRYELVDEGGELGAGGRIEDVANPLFANAIGTELPLKLKRRWN
jgi:hypothetical protein